MSKDLRKIAAARREIAAAIAGVFLPLEQSAHDTATKAAQCVATVLEAHGAAGLPPTAGDEIIELLSDAARLAAQGRAKVMAAHVMFRTVAEENGIAFLSDPDCPPNEGQEKAPLRIVA